VSIHPFPDGNGRHSRQSADYLAAALDVGPLTWGAHLGLATDELRKRYIAALVLADQKGDMSALASFARS
jgi:Fic family protein